MPDIHTMNQAAISWFEARDRAFDRVRLLSRRADRLAESRIERDGLASRLRAYEHTLASATARSAPQPIMEAMAMVAPYGRSLDAVEQRRAAERREALTLHQAALDAVAELAVERGRIADVVQLHALDAAIRRLDVELRAAEGALRREGVELPVTSAAPAVAAG